MFGRIEKGERRSPPCASFDLAIKPVRKKKKGGAGFARGAADEEETGKRGLALALKKMKKGKNAANYASDNPLRMPHHAFRLFDTGERGKGGARSTHFYALAFG